MGVIQGDKDRRWKGLPVGIGGNELGNGVGESRVGVDIEDGDGVFPVVHAAGRENDRDKMDAGVVKEGSGARLCEELARVSQVIEYLRCRRVCTLTSTVDILPTTLN